MWPRLSPFTSLARLPSLHLLQFSQNVIGVRTNTLVGVDLPNNPFWVDNDHRPHGGASLLIEYAVFSEHHTMRVEI
jgi:hypothetical protein